MNFLEILEKQGNTYYVLATAFALTGIIGAVDFLTGYEMGRQSSSRARSVSVPPVRASSSSGVVTNMLFVSPAAG